jgi:hypothetical protein
MKVINVSAFRGEFVEINDVDDEGEQIRFVRLCEDAWMRDYGNAWEYIGGDQQDNLDAAYQAHRQKEFGCQLRDVLSRMKDALRDEP